MLVDRGGGTSSASGNDSKDVVEYGFNTTLLDINDPAISHSSKIS
jgi:hypothetical protein